MDKIELKFAEGDGIVIQNKDLLWLLNAAEIAFKVGVDRAKFGDKPNTRVLQTMQESLDRVQAAKKLIGV